MIKETDALDFIGELSQSTGVKIAVGVNAYVENPNSFFSYTVFIDPSSLSDGEESKLEEYCECRGLRIVEAWNDWGRFMKISKLKPIFASAFSP